MMNTAQQPEHMEAGDPARDRIPVLTKQADDTLAETEIAAIAERVFDEIAPALQAAIAAACEDYIAARETRTD